MAWTIDKATDDIVVNGWENGVAVSPHKGLGNVQNANISTEIGEIMASYGRVQQSQPGTTSPTGTINARASASLQTTLPLLTGSWINISSSTISGVSPGNYYIQNSNSEPTISASSFQISQYYNSSPLSGFGLTGTATYTLLRAMGQPVASATETYGNGSAYQYRYYILDSQGLVWVYDTATSPNLGPNSWVLPDFSIAYYGSATPTGLAVMNGWLHVFAGNTIWCKPTVNLGDTTSNTSTWFSFSSGLMLSALTSPNPHFAFVGHQGKLYYTDGNFIGSIFPNSSILSGVANIQSYASYGAVTTTGIIGTLIGGSIPVLGGGSSARIPAVFFVQTGFNKPAAITVGTMYWIQYSLGAGTTGTFEVYAAQTGGSAIDIASGATGIQYFSTYYPISSGGSATIVFSPERLNLPFFETSQSIVELGNQVLVGCKGNVLYPWNQVDPTPGDLIPLPENNVVNMITVNNMAYIFAGSKGNIYITNGSTASLATSVPDYCAGIPGTPSSYIEPYFTWGGAMYLRGRVWFSILDQTSIKAGNCGGVWSFIPTQNFFIGQDTGLSLRLENQNSYATYSGVATVLLAAQTQTAKSPQYWAGWYSSTSSPLYGIDFTATTTTSRAVIETDLIPTGTMLDKESFMQIEYKLTEAPSDNGFVSISQRTDATSAFVSCGTAVFDGASNSVAVSGYFPANFEKGQWLQLQINLICSTGTTAFPRLKEIRIR